MHQSKLDLLLDTIYSCDIFIYSRSSKVVDVRIKMAYATSLLVINSNLGPILHRFRDIAGFLLRTATLCLFDPNFGGVPV